MKKFLSLILLMSFLLVSRMAYADVTQLKTLMQRNNCLACHMVDKRKYGPSMKDVAEKYPATPATVDMLAIKIKAGGAGVWGADMMPPQPQVTDENAKLMAELIMQLNIK
jgi:cytochrome c